MREGIEVILTTCLITLIELCSLCVEVTYLFEVPYRGYCVHVITT